MQVAGATRGLWLMTDSPSAMTASWEGNERKRERERGGKGEERRDEERERRDKEGGGRREEMMRGE